MNSSTRQIANIIIDSSIITFSSASICISTGIFGFIVYHLIKTKNSPHRVALLLTANVYLALLIFSILLLDQFARALPGHLYALASLNDGIFCQIRAYLQWVLISAIFYSNSLQAIYRLCRVIFHTKQLLQTFQLYKILIIIQWILCFLLMLPVLLLGDYTYSVDDYYCQNEYTNLRSTFINGFLAYNIPMSISIGCYFYTLRKMRRGHNDLIQTMTQIQQISARRDLVVLLRICIILGLLLAFFTPSIILLYIYIFTGYAPWWSSQVQWLAITLSITSVSVVAPLVSPHVQDLWTRNHHGHHHNIHVVAPAIIRIN